MALYIAHATFKDMRLEVELPYGLEDAYDGFWVNEHLMLTKGSDAKYWIPPHRILFVEKFE